MIRVALIAGLFCFGSMLGRAQDQDIEGSKDYPLITRYSGSVIKEYVQKEYNELTLPLGAAKGDGFAKSQHLEGKWTRIVYDAPKGRSMLEVYRNYEAALQRAGFQALFACTNQACGDGNNGWVKLNDGFSDYWAQSTWPIRQFSGRLARSSGDVYVSLHAVDSDPANVTLHIVETKLMETGLVTVDATALANSLSQTGHAAVYGIYFDTGKADLKPESDGALKEIAKLLQQDPMLKLYVVGHTDNQGTLEMNMDLSMRRANAVVQVLSSRHGVAAARLKPLGDGPSAPVAPNDAEEGRAKNRRVELVKQ